MSLLRLCLLLLLPLLTPACEKEPLDTLDELVPATQEGANTFGCRIDGEIFYNRGGSWNVPDVSGSYGSIPQERITISGYQRHNPVNALDYTRVAIRMDSLAVGLQPLKLDFAGYRTRSNSTDTDSYWFDPDQPHEVYITHIDRANYTVSGRFSFSVKHPTTGAVKVITDGRFDAKYQ